MENKFIIDLTIKYGLDAAQVSKITDMVYQSGAGALDNKFAQHVADFICKNGLIEKPAEEIIEELKLQGLFKG